MLSLKRGKMRCRVPRVTRSPCHLVTLSPSHPVTIQPPRQRESPPTPKTNAAYALPCGPAHLQRKLPRVAVPSFRGIPPRGCRVRSKKPPQAVASTALLLGLHAYPHGEVFDASRPAGAESAHISRRRRHVITWPFPRPPCVPAWRGIRGIPPSGCRVR